MGTSAGFVLFVTLGCAKNEVDTDRMRALLLSNGYEETSSSDDADVVIINTCSFLTAATSESIECTLELAERDQAGIRTQPLVMCGCVPSRYGEELPAELPEVAAFVRTDEEDRIVSIVDGVLGHRRLEPAFIPRIKRTVEGAVAYVKISDGCDRMCSFCAIPGIRGRYRSRAASVIIAEACELVAGGVREIVLIGQDTGVWGCDIDAEPGGAAPRNLAQLLVALAEALRPACVWIRVLYLQPEGMDDELVAAIRDTPEVLPYIDIPIQHVSARVLAAMRRTGSPGELEALFARLRREIPGMVIRSTALVGFPGETDEEAEELLGFMDRIGFDYMSVFSYSREEGTLAYDLEGQIEEDVKREREQAAIDLAEALGFAATAAHVGELHDVIVDGAEQVDGTTELIGHAWFQAPDLDGVVHLDASDAAVGDILKVEMTDSCCYELVGHVVE